MGHLAQGYKSQHFYQGKNTITIILYDKIKEKDSVCKTILYCRSNLKNIKMYTVLNYDNGFQT